MTARDHLKKLVEVMQRCDEGWCFLNNLEMTSDEEWDTSLGDAEEWLEENQ